MFYHFLTYSCRNSSCESWLVLFLWHAFLPFITTNVTGRHRRLKQKLRTAYRVPSLKRTFCLASASVTSFYHQILYRTLSLCYACIGRSHNILSLYATFVPNFVSLAASIAPWRKMAHSLTQVIWCPSNRSFCFRIMLTVMAWTDVKFLYCCMSVKSVVSITWISVTSAYLSSCLLVIISAAVNYSLLHDGAT